ncbi:hypothetical protein NAP1_00395 [Erythrobacter sp. NAP1]|nr:hypothetical protein NAP1_00395 [Erythrobacter sp. NAP1]
MQVGRSNNTNKEVVMLTSIRGLTAATLSVGALVTAAPAFAETAENNGAISEELIAASAALDNNGAEGAEIVLSTQTASSIDRASEPVAVTANKMAGESGLTFSANVALTSEYRFRGVDLSGGELAVQGGFDVSHSSGFYVGTWASNLDEDTVGYGSLELDLYGGWSGNVAEAVSVDVGFIAYTYPDAPAGDFDYYEFYGSLGFSLGPASATTGIAYAPGQDGLDFGGGTDDNLYLYTDLSVGIPNTPISIDGHLGYTDGSLTFTNDGEAFDWSIGASVGLGGNFSASVAYVEAEGNFLPGQYDFTDATVVATLSASF